MSAACRLADVGFHAGELAVQSRAGVRDEAARLTRMLGPTELQGGIEAFLADRTFAAITARGRDGLLWISPLIGPAGFLHVASTTTLDVRAAIPAGDPLHDLPAGQLVGLVVIEFATRRRVRINGTLLEADNGLVIAVEQAYGNCPQYIQQRVLDSGSQEPARLDDVRIGSALAVSDIALVRRADTFFLGTTHPARGSDASHRGGPSGFVRVADGRLWWPDYPGNNLFNSFGNLAVDPESALLFADFATGRTLQLSGTTEIMWHAPGSPGDDGHTGRRAEFTPAKVVAAQRPGLHESAHQPYARNPDLTDQARN